MKYLKIFDTEQDYQDNVQNLDTPNVSLTEEDKKVHYIPYPDSHDDHDYVEIGGIKWATMNIGATSETDYGNYYQYGKGADTYQVTKSQPMYTEEDDPLATSADTVAQTWGGNWRMPTKAELQSLVANTNYSWTTINGVNGGKFTDKTDGSKYVFFPAAGYYIGDSLRNVGSYGNVWSSTPNDSELAYNLGVGIGNVVVDDSYRHSGISVRGVLDA